MILNTLQITILTTFFQCGSVQSGDLSGTRWEYVFPGTDPALKDYFIFKEGNKYEFYSAEVSFTYQGVYFTEGDTLNMVEVGTKEDGRKIIPRHLIATISEGKLRLKSFERLEGEWKSKPYSPPEDYYFSKVE